MKSSIYFNSGTSFIELILLIPYSSYWSLSSPNNLNINLNRMVLYSCFFFCSKDKLK